jgi:2-keto-3-deoxy-L-fuconate dehydrogenase
VNNSILDLEESVWDRVFAINVKGGIFVLKAAVPHLIKNGWGSIVLMGSDQCVIGKRNSLTYGASKGSIGQMAKSLALDLAPHNIRVNVVCPGTIDTPLGRRAMQRRADRDFRGDVERAIAEESRAYPLGRIGTSEEIAEAVFFLAVRGCDFMTGSQVVMDGGLSAG